MEVRGLRPLAAAAAEPALRRPDRIPCTDLSSNFNAFSMDMNSAGMLGFTATPSLTCFRRPYCEKMAKANIIRDLISRQLKEKGALSFERHYHVTDPFIQRLGLEAELQGHAGCVNCLEWNEKGKQYDLRENSKHSEVLIDLTEYCGQLVEAKCLTVNPQDNNYLAVGASGPFVRIYDIRMIHNHSTIYKIYQKFFRHLPVKLPDYNNRLRVYLFDLTYKQRPYTFLLPKKCHTSGEVQNGKTSANGMSNGIHLHSNGFRLSEGRAHVSPQVELPPYLEKIKLQANEAFACQQWTQAIQLYSRAVQKAPNNAMLYGNRAAAYMKRKWDGDHYDALRDCLRAISLNPCHLKAHFRLARCLFELKYVAEALECLDDFKGKFPEQAHSSACDALDRDINAALFSKSDNVSLDKCVALEKKLMRIVIAWIKYNAQYIISGSDDGSFFIWEKETTNLVRVLQGDESIVNCLQPHPSYCFLATSGIDPVVRLWNPRPESEALNGRVVEDMESASQANQRRMNADPLEVMLMNMGYRITGMTGGGSGGSDDEDSSENQVHCRTS
ncbi:hypothetical protein E2320_000436 [Naja naja]|nr:hypothetical protein E2320_000436 [Naja naja]